MPSYYFIKLYDDILDDHKMGHLPDRLWRRCIEFFLLANRERNKDQRPEGFLPTVSEMAWTLRCTPDEVERDLQELHDMTNGEGRPIVQQVDGDWFVTRFCHRQEPVSDNERKRRQRERDRVESHSSHGVVTTRDTDTDTELDPDIQTETESDQNGASAQNPAAGAGSYELLADFGVDEPSLTACASFPASTVAAYIEAAKRKTDLHNPPGWVVRGLQSGKPPPRARASPNGRERYVSGEFAEAIQH